MSEFDPNLRALAHIKSEIDRPENKDMTLSECMSLIVTICSDPRTQLIGLYAFSHRHGKSLARRNQLRLESEIDDLWDNIVPGRRKRK